MGTKATELFLLCVVLLICVTFPVYAQLTFSSANNEVDYDERTTVKTTFTCPSRCLCFQGTVRCMFLQLDKLPVTEIPSDTQTIDFRFNRIREITPNSLERFRNLETLLLNDNQISELDKGTFNGVQDIKYLYLHKNSIRNIHPETFKGLHKLTHLYLNSNAITQLRPGTFANLFKLERLFLNQNQIKRIPEALFDNLENMSRLRLDGNALICDCGMLDFAEMLAKHPDTQAAATCSDLGPMPGKQVKELPEMQLNCRKPVIMEEPRDVQVDFGSTVHFTCKAEGDPTPTIVWLHNDNEIRQSVEPRYSILDDGTLLIAQAGEVDGGTYECMAKSSVGEAKSRVAMMETRKHVRPQLRPRFVQIPRDTNVKEGDSILLNCSARGNPEPNILWFLNDFPISQNDIRRRTVTGGLWISSVGKQDGGVYQCSAMSNLGKISTIAKVSILMPPIWIVTPVEQTVEKGTMLVLDCQASGEPIPEIIWSHNGALVVPDGVRVVLMAEGTQLVLKFTFQEDEGEYGCRAVNRGGFLETVTNVRIVGGSPPVFIAKPIYTNTLVAETMRLDCAASGIPPPTILWRKDGNPLRGNEIISILPSGTLLIPSFNPARDSGVYVCSAFNDFGIIQSDPVRVGTHAEFFYRHDTLNNSIILDSIEQAKSDVIMAEKQSIEELFGNISKSGIRSPFELFRLVRFPNSQGRDIGRAAEIYERALHLITKQAEKMEFNLSSEFNYDNLLTEEQLDLLSRFSGCKAHQEPRNNCSKEMCFHGKYRTIDGSCNNLNEPLLGSSYTPFRRLLDPVYENGFNLPIGWTPGKLYNGVSKPLARLISSEIIKTDEITPDVKVTHMLMQWGQFLDHDLDHALPSLSVESYGERVSCRRTCSNVAPCFPMVAPENDNRVRTRRCMEFTRSASVCGSGITSLLSPRLKQREQINQLTAFIDASQVYGSSHPEIRSLQSQSEPRFLRKGIYMVPEKPLMPFATDETPVDCRRNQRESDVGCFLGGDIRVNEQLGLLAMHTIWFRQHNFIANKLYRLNPHWSEEVVFQEARKIVGAQMQHITYKHWLPHVIGVKGMEELGSYQGYNPEVNPMISTEFATAALRFGHTLINPVLRRLDANFESIPDGDLPLRAAFFSPWRLVEEGGVDPVMRGLFATPAKLRKPDQLLNSDLTEELFTHAHLVALDLAAMNIQRGRDHGIPSYNEYRVLCNLSRAQTFDDLKNEITDNGLRAKLATVYKHVDNIDLWVGGVAEEPEGMNARVGPTFRCILVDQFRRLRDGDRFWFENLSVFRPDQVTQIKESTLSRILCDTGDSITEVKSDVFLMESPIVACPEFGSLQLEFWKENIHPQPICPLLNNRDFERQRGRRN